MNKNIPQVQVLMSTFNGAKYIEEQIESIMFQKNVETSLLIRDDGSTDNTINIIQRLMCKFPGRIELTSGKNIGYRKSFLQLFSLIGKYDYYAFADQDDFWIEDKLIRGVSSLQSDVTLGLYSSSLTLTDENLDIIGYKRYKNFNKSFKSFFVRTRLAGCTYVFVPEIAEVMKKFHDINAMHTEMPDHDMLVCLVCILMKKNIFIDQNSYILHRRLSTSETAGGGVKKRVKVEWKRIFNRKYSYQTTVKLLSNELYEIDFEKKYLVFFDRVLKSNNSLVARLRLIFDYELSSKNILADILIRVKILLGYY
ncbi:TPA: glycosyltransferase [Streptococcus suis]